MALNRLLSLIATEGVEPRLGAVSRWTETPETSSWDPEPDYGSFVDDESRVVTGGAPVRAFLGSDDPGSLELAPATARALGDNTTVVFLDWGRQSLSWEEIFELWEAWDSQGMVVDCGAVGLPWGLASRWEAPGWVAFQGDFDGSPLSVVVRKAAEPPSFLAKARLLREANEVPVVENLEELPMLPFTLKDLKNPAAVWPTGMA